MTLPSMITLLLVLQLCTVVSLVNGLTCSECKGVASPEHCRETAICGEGEICYTQEYKNQKGQQAFHLGCMSQQICTIYINAKTVFGKRSLPVQAAADKCYQCCSTEECNAAICQGSAGSQSITTTKPAVEATSQSLVSNCHTQNGCPEMFISFKDFCYIFLPEVAGLWSSARSDCQNLGADLIYVTSKEENDFLARTLTMYKASQYVYYWTAGVYSHTAREFEWVDESRFNYTNWYIVPTTSSYSYRSDYYVVLMNPSYSSIYKTAPLSVTTSANAGVICKKHK